MLSHPLISFPPGRGGGRARGAAWHVRVCDCDEGPLARDHWVCIINNEGALKKNKSARAATNTTVLAADSPPPAKEALRRMRHRRRMAGWSSDACSYRVFCAVRVTLSVSGIVRAAVHQSSSKLGDTPISASRPFESLPPGAFGCMYLRYCIFRAKCREPLQQTRQRNRGLQCSTCAGGMANLEGGELASESEAALVHPSSEAEASAAGQRWPAGGTRLSEGGLASGIESLCGRGGAWRRGKRDRAWPNVL